MKTNQLPNIWNSVIDYKSHFQAQTALNQLQDDASISIALTPIDISLKSWKSWRRGKEHNHQGREHLCTQLLNNVSNCVVLRRVALHRITLHLKCEIYDSLMANHQEEDDSNWSKGW